MKQCTLVLAYDEVLGKFFRYDTDEEVREIYAGDFIVNTETAYENHRNASLVALASLNGSDCLLDRNGFVVNGNYTHVQDIKR